MTRRKFGPYLGLCFVLALAGANLATSAAAQAPHDNFHDALARAARLSTLAEPGAPPFHLKLTAHDTTMRNPEYDAEIEVWWAAPGRKRKRLSTDFLWRAHKTVPCFERFAGRRQ